MPPAARAWDNPIAIACLRLVTFLPELLLNVPVLRSCIAFATFSDAFLPYLFAMSLSLDVQDQEKDAIESFCKACDRRPAHLVPVELKGC